MNTLLAFSSLFVGQTVFLLFMLVPIATSGNAMVTAAGTSSWLAPWRHFLGLTLHFPACLFHHSSVILWKVNLRLHLNSPLCSSYHTISVLPPQFCPSLSGPSGFLLILLSFCLSDLFWPSSALSASHALPALVHCFTVGLIKQPCIYRALCPPFPPLFSVFCRAPSSVQFDSFYSQRISAAAL